jgi:hypothetical protein
MATFAVYQDVPDFLANGTANIETASLLGGNTTLSGATLLGATSLPLVSSSGFPSTGTFTAWLLDGLLSEKVTASISGSNLLVASGTVAAHAAGVSVSSAGTGGCLADVLVRAARMIDNYCRQGPDGTTERTLYALSRTELLRGPSLRASWDTNQILCLWPCRWPIQSVTSVSMQYGTLAPVLLNIGSPVVPVNQRTIEIPYQDIATLTPLSFVNQNYLRSQWFVATLVYTAGACGAGVLAGVPDDIRQASIYLACDILAQRMNPFGLTDTIQGKVKRTFRLRADAWTSVFREHAYDLLDQYATDMYGAPA